MRAGSSRALRTAFLLAVVAAAGSAAARSPLVAELETLAARYHEDPARLDAVRDGLAQAAPGDADPVTWTALARVCFDEAAPANPAEWTMRDAPEARTLLQAIGA